MKTQYKTKSPYYITPLSADGKYLDLMVYRDFPISSADEQWEIPAEYQYRPDLVAYKLYGSAAYWWVFAKRNPNVLVDPVGDFIAGKIIYLPSKTNIQNGLGN